MLDMTATRAVHEEFLTEFEGDVQHVLDQLVRPLWNVRTNQFRTTLYGYILMVFARIDLLASYYAGTTQPGGQGARMRKFMEDFWDSDPETIRVAVSMWRHTLVHTSEPRYLVDDPNVPTTSYEWLLHWGQPITREQHFELTPSRPGVRKLTMGLTYFVSDLRHATNAYLDKLASDADLQAKYSKAENEFTNRKL